MFQGEGTASSKSMRQGQTWSLEHSRDSQKASMATARQEETEAKWKRMFSMDSPLCCKSTEERQSEPACEVRGGFLEEVAPGTIQNI